MLRYALSLQAEDLMRCLLRISAFLPNRVCTRSELRPIWFIVAGTNL